MLMLMLMLMLALMLTPIIEVGKAQQGKQVLRSASNLPAS
jgi:hypothetical protein